MIIRRETEADRPSISTLTMAAFAGRPYSRQTEARIVDALRAAGALALSLVAEIEGVVVGHVGFSPVTISDMSEGWLALGPLSVIPERQRQGIGSALVRAGLHEVRAEGADGCILLGDQRYYGKFGFRNDPALVYPPVPPEHFMVLPFGDRRPTGIAMFHPGFDVE